MISDELKARIVDVEQGSPEWHAARVGKVTASRVAHVIAGTGAAGSRKMSGGSAERRKLEADIISERLTNRPRNSFKSEAMERGNEVEPLARKEYAFDTNNPVLQVGLVKHPTITLAAASPDGLVSADGMVQFKCPDTHTHYATLLGKPIGHAYTVQMQWEMACAGRLWCDFVSFDDRAGDPRLYMKTIRVARDPAMIVELEREVRAFLLEVDATMRTLSEMYLSEAA